MKYTEQFLEENPMVWIRTSYLMADGIWLTESHNDINRIDTCTVEFNLSKKHYHIAFQHVDPNRGDQSCVADVTIRETEWIHAVTADRKVVKALDISFPREIGPEAGTYKGGTIGFLFEIMNGETHQEAFDRMESTYNF